MIKETKFQVKFWSKSIDPAAFFNGPDAMDFHDFDIKYAKGTWRTPKNSADLWVVRAWADDQYAKVTDVTMVNTRSGPQGWEGFYILTIDNAEYIQTQINNARRDTAIPAQYKRGRSKLFKD